MRAAALAQAACSGAVLLHDMACHACGVWPAATPLLHTAKLTHPQVKKVHQRPNHRHLCGTQPSVSC